MVLSLILLMGLFIKFIRGWMVLFLFIVVYLFFVVMVILLVELEIMKKKILFMVNFYEMIVI